MKKYSLIALLVLVAPVHGWAQSDGENTNRRVYNHTQTGITSQALYNSSGSSTSGNGPIPLKQILDGSATGKYNSSSSYYGGANYRPYGMDNNNYSLALSPSEIAASRAKRDSFARQLERENTASMKEQAEALQTSQEETATYLEKFQAPPLSTWPVGTAAPQGRPIYKKRDSGFEVPEKVFNSVR